MQRLHLMCFLATIYLVEITTAFEMYGGIQEKDPSKPEYLDLAKESLNKYLKESGVTQYYKVVQVTRAQEQVVAGTWTKIYFYACPTNSVMYNGYLPADTSYCQPSYPYNLISCHSEIWEKPWEHFKKIVVSCSA